MRPYFHRHYRPPLHKTHSTSSSFIPNAFHISSSNAHQSHSLKINISGRRRMAQRTEKEETIASCVNNCGPSTSSAGVKFGEKSPRSSSGKRPQLERTADRAETSRDLNDEAKSQLDRVPVIRREVNRCSGCRRKVGLTGFRCRCGDLFCSDHRYSDRHECSYDYKAAGREAIARENPVVKAAKLIKL